MDRVRRFSQEILTKYPAVFTSDFEKNKLALSKVAVVTSKGLRNRIAAYIAKLVQESSKEPGPSEAASKEDTPPAEASDLAGEEGKPETSGEEVQA